MKLLPLLSFLFLGCVAQQSNLPPEQCRFVQRLQLDPPGTYHVHQTYPNVTCELNQFGHVDFITNMPVGWNTPDDGGNPNWETFIVFNNHPVTTTFHSGDRQTGLSFPRQVTDGGVVVQSPLLPEGCSRDYNQYVVSTLYVEYWDSTELLPSLLSDNTQLRVRVDICDSHIHDDGTRTCIHSNEETLTVVVDRDPERTDCNTIDPNREMPDPGSY